MIRLAETRLARALGVLVPGPKLPDDAVQSESGGKGSRRICSRCGAVAGTDDERCPVDGSRLIALAPHDESAGTTPTSIPRDTAAS
jgi:hypothetical protein